MRTWTSATYPIAWMVAELTGLDSSPFYPEDIDGYTEQQIRDLYADFHRGE